MPQFAKKIMGSNPLHFFPFKRGVVADVNGGKTTTKLNRDDQDRLQSKEYLWTYSFGGPTEGTGTFLQYDSPDGYLKNPLTKIAFAPLHKISTWFTREILLHGENPNQEQVQMEMHESLGGGLSGLGNLVKMGSNLVYSFKYARAKGNRNFVRNICYLAEKAFLMGGGFFHSAGFNKTAITSLLLAQLMCLTLAPVTLWANIELFRKWRATPSDTKVAGDAMKNLGLNVAKGVWSVTTLTCFASACLMVGQESDSSCIDLPEDPNVQSEFIFNLYNTLAQTNWEMPVWAITLSAVSMGIPSIFILKENFKNFRNASALNGKKDDVLSEENVQSINKRRRFHALGIGSDIFTGTGGIAWSFMYGQALGDFLNAIGFFMSFLRTRYRIKNDLN